MVCCDHQDILRSELCHDFRKTLVKVGESSGVSRNIVAVSVLHIKIDQIDKTESVEILIHISQSLVNTVLVVLGTCHLCDSFSCENIVDLADGENVLTGVFDIIEHRVSRWSKGEIMTAAGPGEMPRCPNKRTGDHTPDRA